MVCNHRLKARNAPTLTPCTTQLDGPYGGLHNPLSRHDRVLLIAGGVGITFIIPQLFSLLDNPGHVRHVDLTWAVPSIGKQSVPTSS